MSSKFEKFPVSSIEIAGRPIGAGQPVFVIAELSANHHHGFDEAVRLIEAAKQAGADAVKLQTYTPDTITLRCGRPEFQIPGGNTWGGRSLYDLYSEAYTPWEWHPKLAAVARDCGITLFSTPFDPSAVEILAALDMPAYKIASFEIGDLELIACAARTGRPLIISTGMASFSEIEEAVRTARLEGAGGIALLKCTSAYPSPPEEMNLATIPHLAGIFGVTAGLSDHTLGIAAAVTAVTLGASIVEKHFTLSRDVAGPDSHFSLEPAEFRAMVDGIRVAENAIGSVRYGAGPAEAGNVCFRRSLFATAAIQRGENFTRENVRSVRPGYGLAPKFLPDLLGAVAARDIEFGTPLSWDLIAGGESDRGVGRGDPARREALETASAR
jgi:N-acetylneuraminate synthase